MPASLRALMPRVSLLCKRFAAVSRAAGLASLGSLALTPAALAQSPVTVQVNSLADGPATAGCGSLGLPTCTLRDAIAFAAQQGASTPVTIDFASSLTANATQGAPAVITLLVGQLELTRSLTITGPGADLLQISGNLGGTGTASRVFQIDGGVTATISGLTFTKGNGAGSTNNGTGGAIYCAGALNLTDSTVLSSSANTSGGGLEGYYSTAITLTRVTVAGNTALQGGGGGIDVEGNASTLTIRNSTIVGNSVASSPVARGGGGIFFNGLHNSTALTLINSTVTGNSALGPAGDGGGIELALNDATFTDSIVAGNTAAFDADVSGAFTDGGGNVAPTGGGSAPYTAATLLLAPLGFYGGHTQTMPALPASPALCSVVNSINSTIPAGLPPTDQRGNPRVAKYGSVSCLDAGAVQTQYTIGSASPSSGYTDTPGALISPSPTATFLESGNNIDFSETNANGANIGAAFGTLSGTLTQTSVTNGNVTFPGLSLNTNAVADNLTYQAFLTYQNFDSNINISASSPTFNVTQPPVSATLSTLVASSTSLSVGGSSTLTVTILSTSGTPLADVAVGFNPSGGTISALNGSFTDANGQLTVQITDSRSETDVVAAFAVVNGQKTLLNQEASVTFTAPVYTITSLADATGGACTAGSTTDANCTLRAAVAAANAVSGGGATIQFAPTLAGTQAAPSTITLTNGVLNLSKPVTITGPGANLLQINGNAKYLIFQISSGVTATLSGLTFTNGYGGSGGAIQNSGTLLLSDSTVSSSFASMGGGIYNSGSAALTRIAVLGNIAATGGGIYSVGALTLVDCLVSGNQVNSPLAALAGGIYQTGYDPLVLTSSTVTGNHSGTEAGGINLGSSTTLTNSIVAGNTAGVDYPDILGTYTDNGGNIAPASNSSTGQAPYTAATLLLSPLGFYGGPTQTMLPLPGSPAICAGLATGKNGTGNPAMDQRGFSHSPQYCTGGSQQDAGAVQTGYALAFTTQPGNSLVNQPIAGPPAVLLTEQQNPFTLAAETVNFGINSGTLSNTSATTSTTTGIATLTASDSTAGAADTLSASVTVAPAGASPTTTATATSNTFSETPLVVSPNSSVVASPTQVFVTQPSTITVTVVSTSGAPIANATVMVSSTNHGAFSQNSGSTNANGVITFQLTDTTPETDVISAVVTYNGASTTLTQTATVTFQAPIFTVNTLADDATGVVQNCLASSNAPCTLRDAVAASDSVSTAGNVIRFAPALAGTQAAPNTITLTNGVLNLTRSTTIQGLGANLLSISGNYGGTGSASQILQVAAGVAANVSGLTLTKGNGTDSGNNALGGAVTNQGTLNLTDSTISASLAGIGGGLYSNGTAMNLTRVAIINNTSIFSGGGIFAASGTLSIVNSTISGNIDNGSGTTFAPVQGGGIYVAGASLVTISNSTITGNKCSDPYGNGAQGGGLYIYGGTGVGPVSLTDTIVAGNTATTYPDEFGTYTDNGGNIAPASNSSNGQAPYSTATILLAPPGYYGGPTQTMPPLPQLACHLRGARHRHERHRQSLHRPTWQQPLKPVLQLGPTRLRLRPDQLQFFLQHPAWQQLRQPAPYRPGRRHRHGIRQRLHRRTGQRQPGSRARQRHAHQQRRPDGCRHRHRHLQHGLHQRTGYGRRLE